MTALHSS